MERRISSQENQLIKDVLKLKKRKYRYREKKHLIEGSRLVIDAILNKAPITQIFVTESFHSSINGQNLLENLQCSGLLTDYVIISDKIYDQLADTDSPQGVSAVVKFKIRDLTSTLGELTKIPFIITLDQVQDPGNLGTILRTAEAAGVDFAILTKGTTDPYNEKAVRASMGAVLTLPIVQLENDEDLQMLESYGLTHYVSDLQSASPYNACSYRGGTNLIIGNEGAGVSEAIKELPHHRVKIPIYGKAESLNASVAAGILLYKIAESRKF